MLQSNKSGPVLKMQVNTVWKKTQMEEKRHLTDQTMMKGNLVRTPFTTPKCIDNSVNKSAIIIIASHILAGGFLH